MRPRFAGLLRSGCQERAVCSDPVASSRAATPEEHTMETTTNTLTVPGATLYYEVRGAGPVLLLICGGVYDGAGSAGLPDQLADRYTLVTYDRRGNSRSPLHSRRERQSIKVHADDARRIL